MDRRVRPEPDARIHLTVAGDKLVLHLPSGQPVDKVRIHATAPLTGYVIGRQVA
ncbi:hypothetical protein [Streptomyces abikoensis]|uniref:hypothetical protein n=1 Tax=Streptomyces abikoensis TaxID=97398 RepID=UPI0033FC1164